MESSIAAAVLPARRTRQQLVIASQHQLDELAGELASNLHRRYTGFDLDVPEMPEKERQHWRARLERDYFACGCAAATVAGIAALVGFLIYRIALAGGIGSLRWLDAAVAVLAFIVGTGLGKSLGTRRARLHLLRTLDQLRERVPAGATRSSPVPAAQCGLGAHPHDPEGQP